jgi:DNA polymerase-3 subunit delta
VKLPPARIEGFLRRPDPGIRAVLFYGPDGGAVREHADTLTRVVGGRRDDPFRVAVLPASQVSGEPARLADEVQALSMTGGRRVVRIRDAADGIAAALGRLLADPARSDSLVVMEADDLGPRSSLRRLVEEADGAAAIPCYLPEARDVEAWAKAELGAAGLTIEHEALALLSGALAADRQLARREIEKLILYMPPETRVTVEAVAATVIDATETTLDDLAAAVGQGDLAAVDGAIEAAVRQTGDTIGALRAMQRHFLRLWQLVTAVQEGAAPEAAIAAARPPIFFKARGAMRSQIRRWEPRMIEEALRRLVEAEAECKRTGRPAETIVADTLIRIARMAARKAG